MGNFGDCKRIKGEKNLFEIRIHMSPGYRIYFGKYGAKVILLLCAGDKSGQGRDIQKAKKYWKEYHLTTKA